MMTAVNTIRVQKGRADEIVARFQTPKSVHTFEGFILMQVLKKENSPDYDELKVCTTWEDRKYFDRWLESRAAEKAHAQKGEQTPDNSPILGSELTTFEVVIEHQPAVKQA